MPAPPPKEHESAKDVSFVSTALPWIATSAALGVLLAAFNAVVRRKEAQKQRDHDKAMREFEFVQSRRLEVIQRYLRGVGTLFWFSLSRDEFHKFAETSIEVLVFVGPETKEAILDLFTFTSLVHGNVPEGEKHDHLQGCIGKVLTSLRKELSFLVMPFPATHPHPKDQWPSERELS